MARNLASKFLIFLKLFHFTNKISYKTKYLFYQQYGVYKEIRSNVSELAMMVQKFHQQSTTLFDKTYLIDVKLDNQSVFNDIVIEKSLFAKKKKQLMNDPNYKGKFVAVLNSKIVDSDSDEPALLKRIYEKHGYISVLIEKIDEEIEYTTSPMFD